MKVYIHTLGCKVNQYESQALAAVLNSRGHAVVPRSGDFDVFIVNTCAVTAESGRKSRQAIRRLKAEQPGALCAVCGCYSQMSPEDIKSLDADLVAGSGNRLRFVSELERIYDDRHSVVDIDDPFSRRTFEQLPAGNLGSRTRAILKIQDGCSNFCSYCIIPYARGPVRSLPLADAAAEAAKLRSAGFKEIVITGIEIASYGKDFRSGESLPDVIEAISSAAPGVRLHLGSLEPGVVTEEFCDRLKLIPCLCTHFHLSLQSGCDATLSRMNRKYDTARFYDSVELLRSRFPDCGITTDLIVGFPGETDEEFSQTLAFIDKCAFSDMHIFPFSPRPGTAAAKMAGQVSNAVKHSRAKTASDHAERMTEKFRADMHGKIYSVLFETEENGYSLGHAENYVPVSVPGTGLKNELRQVLITGSEKEHVNGLILGADRV